MYGSQKVKDSFVQFRIRVPKLEVEGSFTGTGDILLVYFCAGLTSMGLTWGSL